MGNLVESWDNGKSRREEDFSPKWKQRHRIKYASSNVQLQLVLFIKVLCASRDSVQLFEHVGNSPVVLSSAAAATSSSAMPRHWTMFLHVGRMFSWPTWKYWNCLLREKLGINRGCWGQHKLHCLRSPALFTVFGPGKYPPYSAYEKPKNKNQNNLK